MTRILPTTKGAISARAACVRCYSNAATGVPQSWGVFIALKDLNSLETLGDLK